MFPVSLVGRGIAGWHVLAVPLQITGFTLMMFELSRPFCKPGIE